MNLTGKTIIITGGAVRVGKEITLELIRAGATVLCHYYRSRTQAEKLKAEVLSMGGRIHLFSGDLRKDDVRKNLVLETLRVFGQIDGLVNNAAIFFKTPFGKVSEKEWDQLHNTNLKQVFFLSQEVSVHMKNNGRGKIVNIGDAGAETPFPAYLPYSLTKAGIVALTRGLAKALAPQIQVNCVNPGPVMIPGEMNEKEKAFAVQQTLLKREGSARDVARTVRFLFEDSDYITGAIIPVDGGRSVR